MTWTVASKPVAVPSSNCDGRGARVISSDTVASKAFALKRRRVSPHGQRSVAAVFLRQCVSEALENQLMMRPGLWSFVIVPTTV